MTTSEDNPSHLPDPALRWHRMTAIAAVAIATMMGLWSAYAIVQYIRISNSLETAFGGESREYDTYGACKDAGGSFDECTALLKD